jgi:5-methylcytosine-specific restriction endonuclease McrA
MAQDRLHFHTRACRRLYYARESNDLERLRDVVWDKHEGHCAQCGSIRYTEIHHVDGNRGNNRLENLTLLCKKCHTAAHIHLNGGYLPNGRRSKSYQGHSTPAS